MTAMPALVGAEMVTGAGQVTSGASATGGGVGALGVLLQPAQKVHTSSARTTLTLRPPGFFSTSVRVNE